MKNTLQIILIILVLAAIGVANSILIQVHAREREFAVLRTLGISKGQTVRLLLVEGAPGDETRYVSSRDVLLSFASDAAAPIDEVELWVSSDGGESWRAQPAERVGARSLRYVAAADGCFGFYLVLTNGAGSSAEAPKSGSAPHLRVIVDTSAPTFQLHAVTTAPAEPFCGVPGAERRLGAPRRPAR